MPRHETLSDPSTHLHAACVAGPKTQGYVQEQLEVCVDKKEPDILIVAAQKPTPKITPEKQKLYEQNRKRAFQALPPDRQEKIMKQRQESSRKSRERRKMMKGFLHVANIANLNMLSQTACSLKDATVINKEPSADETSLLAMSLWTDASDSGV